MAMRKCPECGADISTSAKRCPKCGKKLKHGGKILLITIFVIILASVCGVGAGMYERGDFNQDKTVNNKVNLEKFNQIQAGMTYQEVVDIIGEEGTLSTESSYGNQSMKIYYWYGDDGISNTTISFLNGKVNAKSQIGLD